MEKMATKTPNIVATLISLFFLFFANAGTRNDTLVNQSIESHPDPDKFALTNHFHQANPIYWPLIPHDSDQNKIVPLH